MPKNRTFRRRYTIEVKGITTNKFMIKFLDAAIGRFMLQLANKFAQLEIVTMSAEELDVHRRVNDIHHCPKCGSEKHTDGDTCLFCAAEEDDHANA